MPIARSSVGSVITTPGAAGPGIQVVQWSAKDPNPRSIGYYFNGIVTTHLDLSFSANFGSDTTNGNTLVVAAVVAHDLFNQINAVSDPVNGAWTFAADILNTSDCNSHIAAYTKFNAQPLLTTSWTGTGSVASGVLTLGSGSGTFRLGQRLNCSALQAFQEFNEITTVFSLASGTLGAPGSTYQLSPAASGTSFSSTAMTTSDFVAIQLLADHSTNEPDYEGAALWELSHTDGSSVYFSGNNDAASAGTDTVTSGLIGAPSSPGIVLGFGFDGGIDNTPYAPGAGTGFGNSNAILTYNEGQPICAIEWQHFSSIGSRAATFSPPAASHYSTVGLALLDA